MLQLLTRYANWLHLRWPAGRVEPLPEVNPDGDSSVRGVYVVGDLRGIPLLKFSLDSGARAARRIAEDPVIAAARRAPVDGMVDVAIIGGGVAGMAAAVEARKAGLSFVVLESSEPFSTIINFPKAKPIFTYPRDMRPEGALQATAEVKEPLVDELRRQTVDIPVRNAFAESIRRNGDHFDVVLKGQAPVNARRVIVAIGRSGNFRKLGVPGENLDKVYNRLHDSADFAGKRCLVVGGGDSALETAIALANAGAAVTLSYRAGVFSRAKPENILAVERLATAKRLTVALGSQVTRIEDETVSYRTAGGLEERVPNDTVFTMIGREAPLDFFRRSGIRISGEWNAARLTTLIAALAIATFVYHWKKTGVGGFDHIPVLRSIVGIGALFAEKGWFPYNVTGAWGDAPTALGTTLKITLGEPGFYYSAVYSALILIFGWRRIRRRRTPYVSRQTWTLAAVQIIPLFLLPYFILPWLGHAGFFDSGLARRVADALFPLAGYGQGREYWRAFGLILAWPLFFWNVFTSQPMWTWLVISAVQTFVIIPAIVYVWGKGAYCGWICSCGALAETVGDTERHKMPHGPASNRWNLAGQVILAMSLLLLAFRVLGWAHVGWAERAYDALFHDLPVFNYAWFVDLFLAGIIGVGLYFHFSGRVWCRFFCPLAALMNVYARFSRFAILPEKKKCISCNVCTTVCHMGIDVMNFANKGIPMQDPQCVRCSACVQGCPTGVLSFGQADKEGRWIRIDTLAASPVKMREE